LANKGLDTSRGETFDQREAFNDEDMAVADACADAIRARGQA